MTDENPEAIILANSALKVEIAPLGAELVRLRDAAGRDYLWNGDPAHWKGRAPVLFPMVGRAPGDAIKVKDALFPLPQHGFARHSLFQVEQASPTRCVLRLEASAATRAAYPFDFLLRIAYELHDNRLAVTATVANPGEGALPFSLGFHPAFRWPLPEGGPADAHEVRFDQPETQPIRRLVDGLLGKEELPNPVQGQRLPLDARLFDEGAMIFVQLTSRKVAFGPQGGPSIEMSFPNLPHFALWTKPGAPFLCLEPWQGFASPEGFDGEFANRPGVVALAPGEERSFDMVIEVRPRLR